MKTRTKERYRQVVIILEAGPGWLFDEKSQVYPVAALLFINRPRPRAAIIGRPSLFFFRSSAAFGILSNGLDHQRRMTRILYFFRFLCCVVQFYLYCAYTTETAHATRLGKFRNGRAFTTALVARNHSSTLAPFTQ